VSRAVIQLIPLDGVVRFGPECGEFGKPYAGLAGFRFIGDNGVELIGMAKCGKFTRADYDAFARAFAEIGKVPVYERRNKDGSFNRRITTCPTK
jgi:hypothetical protein